MQSPTVVLSAVTITMVAALGLSGCSPDAPDAPVPTSRPMSQPPEATAPTAAALPQPEALTGVLYRLADTSIPAEQKVGLVQYATVDDQPALTNFGQALEAGGFDPLTIDATDLAWAGEPGHVIATVTMGSPNPNVKPFTFPMEFTPIRDTWQLSRRTADQLLPVVGVVPPTR